MSIASEINRISNTVSTQAEIIEQIKIALQGKAASEGEGGITPSGTRDIVSNGIYDVTLYEKANVNVPIPNGYIKPNGVKSITQNGDYDVTSFSGASVNVPQPSGVKQITENGIYDVFSFANAEVDVPPPEGFIKPTGTKYITENGTHDATEFESVNVDVPIPEGYIVPEGTKQITENGVHDATAFESVDVNVPIPDGYADVTVTTATADEVLYRQRFVGADGVATMGTMPNIGNVTKTLDTSANNASYTIPKGYHYGEGVVSVVSEEKSVTPTKETQNVIPNTGKVISKVTVNPIPDDYVMPTGALVITENGNYDAREYAGVSVNVPSGGSTAPVIEPLEITENGTYTAPDGVDGYSPITVNVAGGGSTEPDFRDLYQRVEYIESAETGTYPYIITDFYADNDTGVEVVASFAVMQDRIPMGSRQDSGTTRFYCAYPLSTTSCYYGFNTGSSISCSTKVNTKYRLQTNFMNSRQAIIYEANGARKAFATFTQTLGEHTVPISIFGYNSASSGTVSSKREYKLYGARISHGFDVVREYIPCYRKSDGEVGLYEKFTGQFLTNQAAGAAFAKGADIEW